MKKTKIVIIGIIVGLIFAFIKNFLNISDEQFFVFYIKLGIAFISIAILINIVYFMYYHRKIVKSIEIFDTGDFDIAINNIQKMKASAKGNHLNNILRIIEVVFYNDSGNSKMAVQILEGMDIKKINKKLLPVYKLNLCSSYFANSQWDKALQIYNEYEKQFKIFENNKSFEKDYSTIFLTHTYAEIVRGNPKLATEYLEKAKKFDVNNKYRVKIDLLQSAITDLETKTTTK